MPIAYIPQSHHLESKHEALALYRYRFITLSKFTTLLLASFFILFYPPSSSSGDSACIIYAHQRIVVTCHSANLTDINSQLKNPNVLYKQTNDGTWLLKAELVIAEGSTFYINSTDTGWLKIVPDINTPNGIQVFGALTIDSVKITSWDVEKNDYVKFPVEKVPIQKGEKKDFDTVLRPFIRVEHGATGTTNITNSELAYLGYDDKKEDYGESGLNYYAGNGSVIKNNNIHHNRFGFYSAGVSGIIVKNNLVHHNYNYGIDPHSGTHNMMIENNTSYGNGGMGIICSLNCHNITIQNNLVFENTGSGIMFSRNMTNSIARNNYVHDEMQCIFISQSHNNEIYNNRVSDCKNGIYLKAGSGNNKVFDNTIINASKNIVANSGSSGNTFYYNIVHDVKGTRIITIEGSSAENNIDKGNTLVSPFFTKENILIIAIVILILSFSSFLLIPLLPVIRRRTVKSPRISTWVQPYNK